MKRKLNSALLLAGLVHLALVSGCKKKEEAPPAPPPHPAPHALPAKPAAPVQKQLSSARPTQAAGPLDFKTRKDPFKPLVTGEPAPKEKSEKGEKEPVKPSADLLPIQSFEVTKFKISGIIAGLKENRALIVDPTGKGYVVQEGMQIGNNDGRITRITANSVEVVERYKDEKGHFRKRKVVLTLAKKR